MSITELISLRTSFVIFSMFLARENFDSVFSSHFRRCGCLFIWTLAFRFDFLNRDLITHFNRLTEIGQ